MTNEDKNERLLVARVVVTHGDRVLLLRRSETDSRTGYWEVPGGSVDHGESFEEAARREALEEAGIKLEDLVFDHSSSYEFSGTKRIATVFRSEVKNTAVKLSNEHSSNYHNLKLEDPYREYLDNFFATDEYKQKVTSIADDITTNYRHDNHMIAYTDGGSRGNPGPSASGYVIMNQDKQILSEGGEYLGITTNNQAEYQAVRKALEVCIELGAQHVDFFIDSQLVVRQMNGEYKIKNRDLWPIHEKIRELANSIDTVTFTHVYREDNKLADAKVNEVLDNRKV